MEEILRIYQNLHNSLGSKNVCKELAQTILDIMQEEIDKIPDESRIGIRGLGEHTYWLLKTIKIAGKNVAGIFDKAKSCDEFRGLPCYLASELYDILPDCVILSNFFHRGEIRDELLKTKIPIVDFYEALEKKGIKLRGPFYMYKADSPLTLGHFYWDFKNNRSERTLRQFLQAALEQKNFIVISQLYHECGGAGGEFPLLIKVYEEAEKLLLLIQQKIKARKQKDIIMFWTDAIAYSELDNLPNLKERGRKGLFFQNAFTSTPFTESTLQAMFRGVLPIDDYPAMEENIARSNSPLIQFLKNKRYQFACFADFNTTEIKSDYKHDEPYVSNTVVWWHGIEYLLRQKAPCFCLLHFLAESHEPVMYPAQEHVYAGLCTKSHSIENTERERSLRYLDECLVLYDWLLDGKTQILLSDHGPFLHDQHSWSDARIHTYCLVRGSDIPDAIVDRIFPYKNFTSLIRWIIDPQNHDFAAVENDEVLIQDTDFYSPIGIGQRIGEGNPKRGIAYRGVRTEKYKYVINALGEEFFYVFRDGKEVQVPLEDENLRQELQKKCGTHFLDIRKYERFRYSMKLYDAIREADPNSNPPLWLSGD